MIYKSLIRPLLFLLPAEKAHHFTFAVLRMVSLIPGFYLLMKQLFGKNYPGNEAIVAGIKFPNRVGLAAGFDKDAKAFRQLASLGFGFIEIGTLTPVAQSGNPGPRLFRLPDDGALINRMGFNNDGVAAAAERLRKAKGNIIIGGNIGRNKSTSNDNATSDYLTCFRELFVVVDYFVVNISSPNTPGLRALQDKEPLRKLLTAVMDENRSMTVPKPVFLKVAPDITREQADEIIEVVVQTNLAGMIISNTTITRDGLLTPAKVIEKIGSGGLSGKPLFGKSTELLRYISEKSQKRFALIASGGIFTPAGARAKLDAGADLVQLYTGFIYEGPALVKAIKKSTANN